jgi:trehalose 6-phosphate phosphatase
MDDHAPAPDAARPRIRDLPVVTSAAELLGDRLGAPLAVFLDYDGTLTPIVDDPEAAELAPDTRDVLRRLGERTVVGIVSGRDLDDVRSRVGLDGLAYAGSHGFDLHLADGTRRQLAEGHLGDLARGEQQLRDRLAGIAGVRVERKRFAVAVHDRGVDDPAVRDHVAALVGEVADGEPRLRRTGGKRVHELRPDLDWDKGRAIEALVTALDAADRLPVYVGDDTTDEDGFRAVRVRDGVGVVVRGEDDARPTLAGAALADTGAARTLLADLADALAPRR